MLTLDHSVIAVHFEDLATNSIIPVHSTCDDTKALSFWTPRCPRELLVNETLSVPVVVTQNDQEMARVDFLYRSGKIIGCVIVWCE